MHKLITALLAAAFFFPSTALAQPLDKAARQLSVTYEGWDSERLSRMSLPKALDLLSAREERFRDIRFQLAGAQVSPSLSAERDTLAALIGSSIKLIDTRRFVLRQSHELQKEEKDPEFGIPRAEWMSSMLGAFETTYDSTRTAFRRQVQAYNDAVTESSLADSVQQYDRFLEMNDTVRSAVQEATR